MTDLREFLRRHRRVALDTCIFIYQLEANPKYAEWTELIFAWLERPGRSAVTSTITMTEVLVLPYRDANEELVDEFHALLTTYPNLDWIAPDLEIADGAARLRSSHRFRTPDALQAATAMYARATGFVTNDPVFERVDAFETIVLDRIV